ncbi:amidohydrolase family protein [Sphingomicrobium nitratireducens]|uniref:amidohydrolase family protein n=1 Tax=Sphingomicrobium nitratireducens TaxID=2964666 RepID=UPI00223EEA89|nr:amidohydrolase family protein [Sphingomicrobium nitratireducens]
MTAALAAPALAGASEGDLLISNVTVIDTETGTVAGGQDVLIDDGRIVLVAAHGAADAKADEVVDGTGKYLMPGLFDMHAHSNFAPIHRQTLAMMIANGVTAVREMGSDCVKPGGMGMCIADMRASQASIDANEMLGPRMLQLATAKIDSNRSEDADAQEIAYRPTSPEDAQETVDFMIARGADILKTSQEFEPETFRAFAAAANARGIPFGGHIPMMFSVADVSKMGMKSIEHARDLPLDCSTAGAPFRAQIMAIMKGESQEWPDRKAVPGAAVAGFDEKLCAEQIAAMVENDVYYVPTHLTREMDYRAGDKDYREDPRLGFISPMQQRHWNGDLDRTANGTADIRDDLEAFFLLGLKTTKLAHDAGVKVMVGTDANDTMVFPGFSIHDELGHLVKAGFTPMEALQAATSVPAGYFGRTEDFGGISAGKMSDLVLLTDDPIADIGNSNHIAMVIKGTRTYDRATLDAILEEVRAFATAPEAAGDAE